MPAFRIDNIQLAHDEEAKRNWSHTPWGMDGGTFGKIVDVAICDENGHFLFNKAVVEEGNHVITLTYGVDVQSNIPKLALVKEQRDTAAELDGKDAPLFWGPPRGYAEQTDEGLVAAGCREAGEESGARVLAGTPWVVATDTIPNETIVRSRSPWVAVPVDMAKISRIRQDYGEKIFKAEFFSVPQMEDMIRVGQFEGASTRSWCLATAVLYFKLFVVPKIVE